MALAEFIVTFREVFEIALIVGIMLAYLRRTRNWKYRSMVWLGAGAAVLGSVLAAFAFEAIGGGFESNEALFEGVTLVLASLLVSALILWVLAHRNIAGEIEKGLAANLGRREKIGLALFAFVSVFREGVELVLFLGGIEISSGALNFAGVIAGGAAAILLSYAFFRRVVSLDMRKFFLVTSVLLVVLAAGLLSQGVHELQDAGIIPVSIERVYDITPPMNADGSYPLLHEKGAIGALLKGMVGYDTAPSLEQAAAYILYLILVFAACKKISRNAALV